MTLCSTCDAREEGRLRAQRRRNCRNLWPSARKNRRSRDCALSPLSNRSHWVMVANAVDIISATSMGCPIATFLPPRREQLFVCRFKFFFDRVPWRGVTEAGPPRISGLAGWSACGDCRQADEGIIAQRGDGFQRHVSGALYRPLRSARAGWRRRAGRWHPRWGRCPPPRSGA